MRKALVFALSFCLIYAPLLGYAATPGPFVSPAPLPQDQNPPPTQDQGQGAYQPYSPDQLDNLLAPIALYSDPLLAQVLPAATYPDQIDQAAQYVAANGQAGIDEQPWDVSVKAVAHYPTVLNMMAGKPDWTTAIGQAYVNQSADVSASIQCLRHMAYAQKNLATTPQQEVDVQGPYIEIVPAQPQYIYVPTYDPAVVFFRPVGIGVALGFGAGFMIGAWLNRGWAWGGPGIYYTGWAGGGWIGRSRAFVQLNNRYYVNEGFRNVVVNRTVVNRRVNVTNISNYNSVHRNATFNNRVSNRTVVNNPNSRAVNRSTEINRVNRGGTGNTYNRGGAGNTYNRGGAGNTYNRNNTNTSRPSPSQPAERSAPRSFSQPSAAGNSRPQAQSHEEQPAGNVNRNAPREGSQGQNQTKGEKGHPKK